MKSLKLLFLWLILLMASSHNAYAYTKCEYDYQPLKDVFNRYDVVLLGRPTERDASGKYETEIVDVYKGPESLLGANVLVEFGQWHQPQFYSELFIFGHLVTNDATYGFIRSPKCGHTRPTAAARIAWFKTDSERESYNDQLVFKGRLSSVTNDESVASPVHKGASLNFYVQNRIVAGNEFANKKNVTVKVTDCGRAFYEGLDYIISARIDAPNALSAECIADNVREILDENELSGFR